MFVCARMEEVERWLETYRHDEEQDEEADDAALACKTEVLVWRLVICGVIWTQMSAWR